ncbi:MULTISPECIES: class I SAM-dependent methyltransferase [unclassified Rummeliibacillus]|uniref:class I SAM-dependent DNA methyltransferase n=1 Tax=unclassified Rummeliibacillus TaxID=2622809 RepID=UPI000E65FAA0|nr:MULTISPECIES: class I SAM-dependent methyltransferase [unclassified Rummeliibacillus]RIJ67544.1 class I SAM-dependent methyltransferase [Rummeliibacillus sp. POC4]RPJ97104.1 class I SAM-dependent methyltransferase [Rummeliibacillus sp. TYF005]
MSSYGRFAEVYDALMTDVPYDDYVRWVEKYAPSAQHKKLLDIGCGTGTLTAKFASNGYEVSGLDLSEEMLMIASQRLIAQSYNVPLYCMSMDELEGFEELDIVTIAIDSLNYVQEREAVQETFSRIYQSLKQGGQLFFDVHSLFKMDEIFMDSPFTYDDGEITYLWVTEPGEAPHSVHHDMVFYVQQQNGLYERFEEYHYQRTFPIEIYIEMLRHAGFHEIFVTADFTDTSPTEESERIFFRAIK